MKKKLAIILSMASAVSAFAQGTIQFNNFVSGSVQALIYGPEADQTVVKQGNTSTGIPSGSQTYSGTTLAGTGFSAALYGGATSVSDPNSLQVCTLNGAAPLILNFRTGGGAGRVDNPNGLVATVPGVAEGSFANLQLRAWNNAGGTLTSFEAAQGAPGGLFGVSTMFQSTDKLGGTTITPPTLFGVTSFNIHTAVPEPTTIALGVIGATAFLIRRKK